MYSKMALHYDEIFPLTPTKKDFLKTYLPEAGKVLDVGCATGALCSWLKEEGLSPIGLDLDQDMIKLAQDRYPKLSFLEEDMMNIDHLFKAESFQGILCLGNTLVHLPSAFDIQSFLEKAYGLLAEGSPLILQLINYDEVISRELDGLSTIRTPRLSFERKYTYDGDHVLFSTRLHAGDVVEEGAITLYMINETRLLDMLISIGFQDIERYYGYDKKTERDIPLLFVAKK